MAENKNTKKTVNNKKTTTTKKTTTKTTPKKKAINNPTTKSTYNKKTTKPGTTKKTTSTKAVQKKQQTKKVAPKKQVETKKTVEKKVQKLTEEQLLEKTLIFDGRQNQNLVEVVEKLEEKNVVLEDKVIKRSKLSKIMVVILTILIFVVIAITSVYVVTKELEKNKDKVEEVPTLNSNIYKKVVDNYETIGSISNDNKPEKEENGSVSIKDIEYDNIETITLAQFEEKILNKEDMTILISSTTCAACVTFEPTISEVYKNLDKKIYRINVTAMSKEEVERFRTYYKFTVTPTIFMIKDGYVKAETTGQMFADELTTWVTTNA